MTLALEMKDITKYFSSTDVQANDQVNFSVESGEVHALVGENGAGKTTLMNILYGLIKPDSGEIFVDGKKAKINHPDDAIHVGIGMVHQHFKLVPSFTVAQNILLGMEPNTLGVLNRKKENELVAELAKGYGLPVDPTVRIRDLSVGMQQRVEILKILERKAKTLILDEPTAVLTPQEVNELVNIVHGLSKRGFTIIFITHKLLEVMHVADRVSVMRGGHMVGTKKVSETSIREMARMMVGREVLLRVNHTKVKQGKVVFEARDLSVANNEGRAVVDQISLQVHEGEILGIAGVSGNGQTELVEAITGMCTIDGGSLHFMEKEFTHSSVRQRRELGMAHIPEDRMRVGLNLGTNLDENLIVSRYKKPEFNKLGFLRMKPIREFAADVVKRFSIMAAHPGEGISMLSGGNLQKIIVGRELSGNPKLIVANQPTRGLDVGSIEFVHRTLMEARSNGVGVLLISVELEEIMSLSDRILVLFRGQVQGEVNPATTTEEEIGILMAGGKLDKVKPGKPLNRKKTEQTKKAGL
jgi:general nucleoside transport system ATP-binding protein